jgi:vacuolar-type H+-ATPase subunit I/STV1
LPPSKRPVPEQQLEVKTVESDRIKNVVGSGQQVPQAKNKLESTAKDLEESDVDENIEAAHESSNESEEEDNVDSTGEEQLLADHDSDSDTGIMTPQTKFLSPKVFKATSEDDAFDWLERYESTGAYNQWGNTELRANFSMYLDGLARK